MTPKTVVERQLQAYNDRDIDAFGRLFAQDAVVADYRSETLRLSGRDEIVASYGAQFTNRPDVLCVITETIECGPYVLCREVAQNLAEAPVELVAIYEVRDELIQSLVFVWPR